MAQGRFEEIPQERPERCISEAEKSLSSQIVGAELKSRVGERCVAAKSGLDEPQWKALGLPCLDLGGFEQEAPYRSQGKIKDILHEIKHTFVKDETLDDKIRQHVESKMTPEEHKRFDDENKALSEHERQMISWASSMMIPPPPYPRMPETPMHNEIVRRAEKIEEQISVEVKGQMSQTDIRRLNSQMKEYQEKYREATTIRNPLGTGEGYRGLPTPGNAVKDYFDRVSEATERYLTKVSAAKDTSRS